MKAGGAACTKTESPQGRSVVIALIPIASSQIAAVGYDAATRELVIKFRDPVEWARRSIPMTAFRRN